MAKVTNAYDLPARRVIRTVGPKYTAAENALSHCYRSCLGGLIRGPIPAAYGDLEKLQRLVESEGCSVSQPDSLGYYALQWAALNNRAAAAQYIIQVSIQ